MKINIIDGRKTNSFENSTKILVDVFRSTSTMPVILEKGASKIIPTSSVREARDLKSRNPDYVLVGERYGIKVPGFDLNNSPSDVMVADVREKTIIFTSTNGTLVLKKIAPTGKVYVSSFINADATFQAVKNLDRVDIVVSSRPDGQADEDFIYADYLSELLSNGEASFEEYAHKIRNSKGSRRLKIMGYRKDIETCLMLNFSDRPTIFKDGIIIRE
ncbi:MAG: 2-phosphosulfolactate phosphatase [Candidatus Thermoplasmatota archaeon]|nr:2-phosphosulfolactate phosphatase [Candidatus Thermoplasmatota archaeon]